MVPVLHAGTPHRVSLRGFQRRSSAQSLQIRGVQASGRVCVVPPCPSLSIDRRFYISDYVAHKLYGTSDTFLSVVSGMVYYTDGAAGRARTGEAGLRWREAPTLQARAVTGTRFDGGATCRDRCTARTEPERALRRVGQGKLRRHSALAVTC
jgi:hypothetical protein